MKTKENLIVKWEDNRHGWFEIPIQDLFELGIADKISSYSYMRDGMAFLEEDCDAHVYFEAKYGKKYWEMRSFKGDRAKMKEINTYEAPCRAYDRFSYPHLNEGLI